MPATDPRRMALARCRIWQPGQARPRVSIHEYALYDVLKQSAGESLGTWSFQGYDRALEYLHVTSDLGFLVCRPSPIFQDTRLSAWSTSGGTWQEIRPTYGRDRKYRLVQSSTTASVQFVATSANMLPANPSVAFELTLPDTPGDHNSGTFPPFARLELGQWPNLWALEFSKILGARLLAWDVTANAWRHVRDLPEPERGTEREGAAFPVWLRCHRGFIGVSTDLGKNYAWHPGTIGAGVLRARGQGGQLVLGIHQLLYPSGTWTSPGPISVEDARDLSAALEFEGSRFSDSTNGGYGTLTLSDLSSPTSALVQYLASFTPATGASPFGWQFSYSPELYAVLARYPAVPVPFGGAGPSENLPDLLEFTVTEGEDLGDSTAQLSARLDPDAIYAHDKANLPQVEIAVRFLLEDDTLSPWVTLFVGVVDVTNTETRVFRDGRVSLACENVAFLLKLASWDRANGTRPYRGMTLNAALDAILESEAIPQNVTFRQWHPSGDTFLLLSAEGDDLPEDPFAWPRPGESKWDFMRGLCALAGLDLGVSREGALFTAPSGAIAAAVSKTYEADPASDLTNLVRSLRWAHAGGEARTRVVVDGVGPDGQRRIAIARDWNAEQNQIHPRFTPVRITEQVTVDGTVSQGIVNARAQAEADRLFREPAGADLEQWVDPERLRREIVKVEGFAWVGVPETLEFAIRTLEHHFQADPSMGSLSTQAGLKVRPTL